MVMMMRNTLAQAVARGLDDTVPFSQMNADYQSAVLRGVDALLTLYKKNSRPDENTIMRTFNSAYGDISSDISEWSKSHLREMSNVAKYVERYARVERGEFD